MIKQNKHMYIIICVFISLFVFSGCEEKESEVIYSGGVTDSFSLEQEYEGSTQAQDSTTETATPAEIYVQICGAVRTPGVYKVESGLRIFQVIELAGGITEQADINAINMARPVTDEMNIYIPSMGESAIEEDSDSEFSANPEDARININTASKEELMTLTGIGEAKAEAIISYREESGGFTDITQIMNISGIKEAAFNKIKDDITIG